MSEREMVGVSGVDTVEPIRVLIDRRGRALSPRLAAERGFYADVVFTRDDGWTLGAPLHLEAVAERLWAGRWIRKEYV